MICITPRLVLLWCSVFWLQLSNSLVEGADTEKVLRVKKGSEKPESYKYGDRIMVECLNRTVETGEHRLVDARGTRILENLLGGSLILSQITDATGELQYIPFPICNETSRPLELLFGSEKDINCTLPPLTDSLYHLFEFYIHNDAPLSCRIPSLPSPPSLPQSAIASQHNPSYTHLQIALTGTLQLSHLHINPALNVILHTTSALSLKSGGLIPEADTNSRNKEDAILAATAYSLPPTSSSPRVVIGDPLPLTLSVRWYSARTLPPSTARVSGLGGHVHLSTVVYGLLSFGCGVAVSLAYFRGVEMPRRLRRYGEMKAGGDARNGYAWMGPASGKLE